MQQEMSQSAEFVPQSVSEAVEKVSAVVAAEDYERAGRMAAQAVALGHIHPALYNAQAIAQERQGKDEEALAFFLQARALTPKDSRLLNAIGLCLTRLHRHDQAVEIFDEAIRMAPAYAVSHHRKGLALGLAGDWKNARAAHARAAQLDARYADAIASVASIAARTGDAKTARAEAERALRIDPANATAAVALAQMEIAEGKYADAEIRLNAVLAKPELFGHGRSIALGLLGDALDGENREAEAFSAYAQSNSEMQKLHASRFAGRAQASMLVDGLVAHLELSNAKQWRVTSRVAPSPGSPVRHVFLLGFPRSGTTLVEQALGSHADVAVLDEREILADFGERFLSSGAGLEQLANLEQSSAAILRQTYFERARELGLSFDGKVLLDKHPLNTIKLPLIARLFPDARILFAVRDPRDVVLSCFRRHLDVDLAKFELLSLEGTARLYDRVMKLGLVSHEMFELAWREQHYERVIADFEGEMRAICEFVEIPWNESLKDFARTAQSLDVRQASTAQVRRGLYGEGVGQWRRYERELVPVLPILKPWIDAFGY